MEHPQERYWPEIIEDYASLDQGVEPCQMFKYTNLLERKTMLRSGLCPDRGVDPCQMRLLCSPQLHRELLLLVDAAATTELTKKRRSGTCTGSKAFCRKYDKIPVF